VTATMIQSRAERCMGRAPAGVYAIGISPLRINSFQT